MRARSHSPDCARRRFRALFATRRPRVQQASQDCSRESAMNLQDTTTRCNTLQHAATYCNTLQHTGQKDVQQASQDCSRESAMNLQRTATCCNTLPHAATRCNTLQHTATRCNMLQRTGQNDVQQASQNCSRESDPYDSVTSHDSFLCAMTHARGT